ncbi:MatE family [Polymorphum gilvum SL003B-26A1]|uniref:MatE family n=2 Tax=Polymorphum TaxID=991903 RepID=F2J071_POLGS|nr:MatE family [Polymorphum gilvum SL003B-26A1]
MALSTFAIRIVGAGLAYLSQILMARWMGAHDYGVFSVVWTLVMILGLFACLGFSASPNRFVPEYAGDPALLRGYLHSSRLIAVGAASLLALLGFAGIWLLRPVIDPVYVVPAYLAMLALPVFTLVGVQDGIARSYDWPALAMLPTYIWRPLTLLALLSAAMLLGYQIGATAAAAAAVAATWAVGLYQLLKLNGNLRGRVPPGPRRFQIQHWLAISLPMLLVEGFLQLITSADVIMVSFWRPPDEVGVYFAASKTLALVHFVYFAVRAASAHRFSSLYRDGDPAALDAYVRMATRWTFWPSLAGGVLLLALGPFLLRLFGAGFEAGYPLIAVLLVGVLARASVGPADALLSMSGHQKSCAGIYAGVFGLNVVLNVALIPMFGLIGAALATAAAIFFEAVALSLASRRKLGVTPFILASAPVGGAPGHGAPGR